MNFSNRILLNPDLPFLSALSRFRNTLSGLPNDFFTTALLETTSFCNRRCSYCLNSVTDRGLIENRSLLDIKVIEKIVDELAMVGFKGTFLPHGYGEPLLDERLLDICRMIKSKIPESKIGIHTNGDLLDFDKYLMLVNWGVNFIVFTEHDESPSDSHAKFLFEYSLWRSKHKCPVFYRNILKRRLFNRGGLISVRESRKIKQSKCDLPSNSLVVTTTGDIALCCNDYSASVCWGNLKEERLIDIWNKPDYAKARDEIRKGTFNLDICRKCIEK